MSPMEGYTISTKGTCDEIMAPIGELVPIDRDGAVFTLLQDGRKSRLLADIQPTPKKR